MQNEKKTEIITDKLLLNLSDHYLLILSDMKRRQYLQEKIRRLNKLAAMYGEDPEKKEITALRIQEAIRSNVELEELLQARTSIHISR